ncbi:MAG: hypothetical protein IKV61_00905 [Clostridia bacterium]|nr:hypothetical protein [Clostridia bacterium]
MKKLFAKIVSLIMAAVLSTAVLSGCSLIVTDAEKDMALVVATVALDENLEENIIKRDMVSAYTSNAYYYQYYGTSNEDAYNEIMTSLTQNLIVVQQSMKALVGATGEPGNEKGYFEQASNVDESERTSKEHVLAGWGNNKNKNFKDIDLTGYKNKTIYEKLDTLKQYLTEYEYAYARYNALLTIDTFINEFKDEEEAKTYSYESFAITNRTTLTVASDLDGDEYQLKNDSEISKMTDSYKKSIEQVSRTYNLGVTIEDSDTKYDAALKVYTALADKFDLKSPDRKKSLTKVISQLKKLGYITADEAKTSTPTSADEIFKANSFFASVLKTEYESLIVSKYKMALVNQQERYANNEENIGNLYAEYKTLFESQKIDFDKSSANYEAKLESASENSYIAYHPNKGSNYGYVANLLIGFNKEQQALVDAFESNVKFTDDDRIEYRNEMLKNITVKDLRQTWVLSNLGEYDETAGKFTFGNDYVKTDALKVYGGKINGATPYTYLDGEEEKTAYTYKGITEVEMSFDSFISGIFKDVLGVEASTEEIRTIPGVTVTNGAIDDATMDKFRDLIYAYSTDGGSLTENYGYLYSPMGTSFVKEFEDTQKALIEEGVGSIKICVTKYGYHIMLCTKIITPVTEALAESEFVSQIDVEGTMPYEFKQYKVKNITTTTVNDIVNSFIAKNSKNENVVKKFENTYKDLIEA